MADGRITEREIVDAVASFDGVLVLAPGPGSAFPETAWGDSFFYYAPDGEVPTAGQPFATIVTKDYPDDAGSRLDPEGRFRVNIHVGRDRFRELTGEEPGGESGERDSAEADAVLPHPLYRALGWVSVVVPAERTSAIVLELLRSAHADARARAERRG